jgi:hypothetical protein
MCECNNERPSPPQFCRVGDCLSPYEQRVRAKQPMGFTCAERGPHYVIFKDGIRLSAESVVAALDKAESEK